ncbi:ABC-2 family transporter protein [compost metagenome]
MKTCSIIWFEIRKLIKTRTVLFNLFLMPLLLIFILGNALAPMFASNEDGVISGVNVMLVKQSDQDLNEFGLKTFLDTPEMQEMLNVIDGGSREEALAAIREGEMDFAVVIPPDFVSKVKQGEAATWNFINGQSHSKNHVAQMIFDSYLDEVNRTQATTIVLGPTAAVPVLSADGSSTDGQDLVHSYVENASLNKQGKSYSAFQYYAASMLIMFLLYSGLVASESLHSEIDTRTLYRLQSMPISTLHIFVGKVVGNSFIAFLQAAVIILGTTWLYDVDWGTSPQYLALICVLVVLASMMMAVSVSLLCKSSSTAKTVVQMIVVFMTFFSGGFQQIPVDIVQKIGEFTVNHWALQGILRIMLGADQGEILHHALMLGLVSGVFLIVGAISYRKVGYHE